jgi:ABC-type spermidine/putrescine transport system permease subunit I
MQNTRLNTLIDINLERLSDWAHNPWRRTSLAIICLLLGFFIASAVSTTFGARSEWDVFIAGIATFLTEVISRVFYWSKPRTLSNGKVARRSLILVLLNDTKVGIIYGLALEACKLGS